MPGGKQKDVAAYFESHPDVEREDMFITTKIPAGFGWLTGMCLGGAEKALEQVRYDLDRLNTSYVDLVLLHAPCNAKELDLGLWRGLEEALAQNLTRAIGVSNYQPADLAALEEKWVVPPAARRGVFLGARRRGSAVATLARRAPRSGRPQVNQCEMSVGNRDDAQLNATQSRGITYEAYVGTSVSLR